MPRSDTPYVGPKAYTPEDRIYGRGFEAQELVDRLLSDRIVLLYSPSGAGKTSLIEADVRQRLAEDGFDVLPTVRVSHLPEGTIPLPRGTNRFILSLLMKLDDRLHPGDSMNITRLAGMKLDDYLAAEEAHLRDGKEHFFDVLIIDQFEEILTFGSNNEERERERRDFFEQMGQALKQRHRFAIFAMREDYVASLDPYLDLVPTHLAHRIRLELLKKERAIEAIEGPAEAAGVAFERDASEALVDNLLQGGLFVEPVQLQVVCVRLWERLIQSGALADQAISRAEVEREVGEVEAALAEYYDVAVADAAVESKVSERKLRTWFEEKLITSGGVRDQVQEGPEPDREHPDATALQELEDRFVIRKDERRGATWYELSHDRLIHPIQKSNAAWRVLNLRPLQWRSQLWIRQGRSESLLLRGPELKSEAIWAKENPDELTGDDQKFLEACQKARRSQRGRRLFWGVAAAAVVLLLAAGLFWRQTERLSMQHRALVTHRLGAGAMRELELRDRTRAALLARQAVIEKQALGLDLEVWWRRLLGLGDVVDSAIDEATLFDIFAAVLEPTGYFSDSLPPVTDEETAIPVNAVAYAAATDTIAYGGGRQDRAFLRVAVLGNDAAEQSYSFEGGLVSALALDRTGRWLAAGVSGSCGEGDSPTCPVLLWDLEASREGPDLPEPLNLQTGDNVRTLAFGQRFGFPAPPQLLAIGRTAPVITLVTAENEAAWSSVSDSALDTTELRPRGWPERIDADIELYSLAFDPGGHLLAAASRGRRGHRSDPVRPAWSEGQGLVSLWRTDDSGTFAEGASPLASLAVHSACADGHDPQYPFPRAVAFSRDGGLLATGGGLSTRVVDAELVGRDGSEAPCGESAATKLPNAVVLWSLEVPERPEIRHVLRHKHYIWSVGFTHGSDGGAAQVVATCSAGKVLVWDSASGRQLERLDSHEGFARDLSVGRAEPALEGGSAPELISGGQDGVVRLWRRQDGRAPESPDGLAVPRPLSEDVRTLVLDPGDQSLGWLLVDGALTRLDRELERHETVTLPRPAGASTSTTFSVGGDLLLEGATETESSDTTGAGSPAEARIALHAYRLPPSLQEPGTSATLIGQLQMAGALVALDVASGEPAGTDRPAAILLDDATVQLVHIGKTVRAGRTLVSEGDELVAVAIGPRGRWLAAGDSAGMIHVWRRQLRGFRGRPEKVLDGSAKNGVNGLDFSDDGRLLASAHGIYSTGAVLVWEIDRAEDQAPLVLEGEIGREVSAVAAVAFERDGHSLIAQIGGSDQNLREWKMTSRLAEEMCALARRPHLDRNEWLEFSLDRNRLAAALEGCSENTRR